MEYNDIMRVLIVEDEKNLNSIIKKQLESQGYSVDACLDGLEAKDYMEMTDYVEYLDLINCILVKQWMFV